MRIRQIKPEFHKHVGIGELSIPARYLFKSLLHLADCEGRFKDEPKWIKAELLPYDEDVSSSIVDEWLCQIAEHDEKFIIRYEVDGKKYIQITNFRKHQHLMGNEAKAVSTYPPPPSQESSNVSTYSVPISTTDIRSNGSTEDRITGSSLKNNSKLSEAPEDFQITERMMRWATEKGFSQVDVDRETPVFLDHHRAKGNKFKDWEAAWRTWMGNSRKFSSPNPGVKPFKTREEIEKDKWIEGFGA